MNDELATQLRDLPEGESVLLPVKDRSEARGALQYWARRLGCKWKTRMTTKGLRVWKKQST